MNLIVDKNSSQLLADKIYENISIAIENKGEATVVLSGGSTPKPMLVSLFSKSLDWQKVTLFFSDERYVPNTHKDSNYQMLQECLNQAGLIENQPEIEPYYYPETKIEQAVEILEDKLRQIEIIDAVVVGMGLDGHFASLFPDDKNIKENLSLNNPKQCSKVQTQSSPYERISLTFSRLLRTDNFYLLISGKAKLEALKNAEKGINQQNYRVPVTSLFQKDVKDKVQVYCQEQNNMKLNKTIQNITDDIKKRSEATREKYLSKITETQQKHPPKIKLPCGNIAHSLAACSTPIKNSLTKSNNVNIGVVSAYNDMLSAHQPYRNYPETIKQHLLEIGGTAQFAGGVPSMCDGVTQGQPGMEISLFSRDVIAMSTGVALSHNVFDGFVCLGVCDKIVPGQLIGSLSFGHLPGLFIPSGPMVSGISNHQKSKVRRDYAEGKIDREALLKSEMQAYHAPGTCTFYGTANTNQMMLEFLGLMLPGSAFINPNTPLREALTKRACLQIHQLSGDEEDTGIGHVINEKSIVNAIVAILATGGSTNHTIHLIAIAAAAGIIIDWSDMAKISEVIPLLARVYPNGQADVNHFQAAGGVGFLIKHLLKAGYLHEDVMTVMGKGLHHYTQEPFLEKGEVIYKEALGESLDLEILRPINRAFSKTGGIKVLSGNIGRGVIKVSSVEEKYYKIKAPALVFESQEELAQAFHENQITEDCIIVVRQQGPSANGMPELHQLTPLLTLLLKRGLRVALVTDGRMSGASGKVPAAIQLHPEAQKGGAIAKIRDGDIIELDITNNQLNVEVDFESRESIMVKNTSTPILGADMFSMFRKTVSHAEKGASIIND